MAKLPRRKCAHKACRQWFHPVRDGQVVCSFECASAIGKEQTAKAREAAKQKESQRQRAEEKAGRRRRKAKRESFKTKAQWDKGPNRPSTATSGSGTRGKNASAAEIHSSAKAIT